MSAFGTTRKGSIFNKKDMFQSLNIETYMISRGDNLMLKNILITIILFNSQFVSAEVFTYKQEYDKTIPHKIELVAGDLNSCHGQLGAYFQGKRTDPRLSVSPDCEIIDLYSFPNSKIGEITKISDQCISISWYSNEVWGEKDITYIRFFTEGYITGREYRGRC